MLFNYCAGVRGVIQTHSMHYLLGSLAITAFAGVLAFATAESGDDLVYLDVGGPISCEVEYGRQFSKVIIEDFISYQSRNLQFLSADGQIVKMDQARCGFEENLYICRWGKTNELVINLSNTSISEVTAKPRHFVHGYIKPDVFRPKAAVSCPTN